MKRWLDFSGAPPLLIPARLASLWRGGINPTTGGYSDLNTNAPSTDYDHACAAAWPGRGLLSVRDSTALALYTEFDEHTWDDKRMLVACGSWLPTDAELTSATWSDPLKWEVKETDFLLMNSAVDGESGLNAGEFVKVRIPVGRYIVEYAYIEGNSAGCFHRLTLMGGEQ
jgi:Immunity protein 21